MSIISESEFDNVWGAHAKENGDLYSYHDVRDKPLNTVWSIIDCDDGSWIASAGFHVVNVIGYVLTTMQWDSELLEAFWFEADDLVDEDEIEA